MGPQRSTPRAVMESGEQESGGDREEKDRKRAGRRGVRCGRRLGEEAHRAVEALGWKRRSRGALGDPREAGARVGLAGGLGVRER